MERSGSMQKDWMRDVEGKLQGVNFPLDRDTAEDRLSGTMVGGKDITQYFDRINWPINSKDELMNKMKMAQTQMSQSRM